MPREVKKAAPPAQEPGPPLLTVEYEVEREAVKDRQAIKNRTGGTAAAPVGVPQQVTERLVPILARTIDVFGNKEKALRWLKTPAPSLGDRIPMSMLDTPQGISEIEETLGAIEHGMW